MAEGKRQFAGHGWGVKGGPALHVGNLPHRKSVCLYVIEGSTLTVLAYFRDEDKARHALRILDQMMSFK